MRVERRRERTSTPKKTRKREKDSRVEVQNCEKGGGRRQSEILRDRGETERDVGREAREQHRKRIKWSEKIKGW